MTPSATRSESVARSGRAGRTKAFTLVEILLAIGLASMLLLVALTFYHQATDMRGQVLREMERLSTLRLVLDRLAGDLRAAQAKARPGNEFIGGSNSMSFVKEAYVGLSPFAASGTAEPIDLVRVSFTTLLGTNAAAPVVSGLDRSEFPFNQPVVFLPPDTNTAAASATTNGIYVPAKEPFGDVVRFVRFRYWNGASWQDGWTNVSPPAGVEIVLGLTPNAEDAEPDTLPTDVCRRVVFVPGGIVKPPPGDGVLAGELATGGNP